jgi:hypothetical protein
MISASKPRRVLVKAKPYYRTIPALTDERSEMFAEWGRRGARTKLERYGPDYYRRIRRGEKPSQDGKTRQPEAEAQAQSANGSGCRRGDYYRVSAGEETLSDAGRSTVDEPIPQPLPGERWPDYKSRVLRWWASQGGGDERWSAAKRVLEECNLGTLPD